MQDEQKKPSFHAVVRVDGPQTALASAARSLAARLAPAIPAPIFSTMNEVLDDSMSAERMMALLAVFFAGCALLVTAIGLYGTLAYATARRTSEIGIRMALGAQRMRVMAMVFRENALVAAVGAGAGLGAAAFVFQGPGQLSVRNVAARSLGAAGVGRGVDRHRQRGFSLTRPTSGAN